MLNYIQLFDLKNFNTKDSLILVKNIFHNNTYNYSYKIIENILCIQHYI